MALVKTIGPAAVLPEEGFDNYIGAGDKIAVPFTTIQNRAKIINLAADGSVNFGINRIQVQNIAEIRGEFGPNNEKVFSLAGDRFDQVRFVGNWYPNNAQYGPRAVTNDTTEAYVEITFFGTGLNYLTDWNHPTNDQRISVDGGPETTYTIANQSGILSSKNYSANVPVAVASGLALGIHTVKIRTVVGALWLVIHGFEVLNEVAQLDVRPLTAYIDGNATDVAQTSISYNSDFTNVSGTAGAKGGAVIVYANSDGEVKKDIQYTDVAQANLTSADHSNEEVIRTYNWREFGCHGVSDFSDLTNATRDATFTLDDGTTILTGNDVLENSGDNLIRPNNATDFLAFTFVGTGLDIMCDPSVAVTNHTVEVNGVSVGNIAFTNTSLGRYKIVSGLPYGTNTVKIIKNDLSSNLDLRDFIVYAPKKPALPENTVALSSYYLMADFVFNTSPNPLTLSNGVLRKSPTREVIYEGAWNINASVDVFTPDGKIIYCTINGNYLIYTFFGTGIDYRFYGQDANTYDLEFEIDGSSDLSGFTTSLKQSGTGLSFTTNPANVTGTPSGSTEPDRNGAGFSISGLALGVHTIKVTRGAGSSSTYAHQVTALDIITPIHSPKNVGAFAVQKAFSVGSTALSDDRNISGFEKETSVAEAINLEVQPNQPNTQSTIFYPIPSMISVIETTGNPIAVDFIGSFSNQSVGGDTYAAIYVDGVYICERHIIAHTGHTGYYLDGSMHRVIPVSAGIHTVQIFWKSSGTVSKVNVGRTLTVKELK